MSDRFELPRMLWFGEDWHAPVNESCEQAPTPTGLPCMTCEQPIEAEDSGFLVPFVGEAWMGPRGIERRPHHRDCFLRMALGPNHKLEL